MRSFALDEHMEKQGVAIYGCLPKARNIKNLSIISRVIHKSHFNFISYSFSLPESDIKIHVFNAILPLKNG